MSKHDNRFIITEKQGGSLKDTGLIKVIVDRETGVNYLWHGYGNAGGLTPLLNADGTPVVTPKSQLMEE